MWHCLGIPPLLEKNSSIVFVNFCIFIASNIKWNATVFNYFERIHVENKKNPKYSLKWKYKLPSNEGLVKKIHRI